MFNFKTFTHMVRFTHREMEIKTMDLVSSIQATWSYQIFMIVNIDAYCVFVYMDL